MDYFEEEKTAEIIVTPKKKSSFLRKILAITGSAALFGGISGMVINVVSGDMIEELKAAKEAVSYDENEHLNNTLAFSTEAEIIDAVDVEVDYQGKTYDMDVSDIASAAMPSIVAINIKSVEEIESFFGQVTQYESEGSGSGIIIGQNETELLILTNNHVVSGASTVSVAFIDEEVLPAKVKSIDSANDLAVIVVDLSEISKDTMSVIKYAKIGNSDELRVGEQVVAIGNALGYGQSVTTGIVSAKDRETTTNATPLIQTDAAINPGNSGGALLNMKGELVGINSAKYSSTDVEGMGYAIPISAIEDKLEELINAETREKVDPEEQGYLGITCQNVSAEASYMYGIPEGILITDVKAGSGAKIAGLKKNYIITGFAGQKVTSIEELTACMEYYAIGEEVEITYMVPSDDTYIEKTTTVLLGENLY